MSRQNGRFDDSHIHPAETKHLEQIHVKHRDFKDDGEVTLGSDEVRQIDLRDPDRYWIGVNDIDFRKITEKRLPPDG